MRIGLQSRTPLQDDYVCPSKHRTRQNLLEIVLKHQVTMGLVSSESDVLGSMERDEDHPYRWSTTFFAHPSHPGQINNVDFVKDRFVVQFDANEFVNDLAVPPLADSFCCHETCFVSGMYCDFNSENGSS